MNSQSTGNVTTFDWLEKVKESANRQPPARVKAALQKAELVFWFHSLRKAHGHWRGRGL